MLGGQGTQLQCRLIKITLIVIGSYSFLRGNAHQVQIMDGDLPVLVGQRPKFQEKALFSVD
jgi:hypothetical protein